MLSKQILLKIYEAASMQRWNDQIRTVELTELDKQAHKMIIAYVLGKLEEERRNKDFNWVEVIEGGIFEFLQRIILTDLKPPLFHRIKEDRKRYEELNHWVYEKIEGTISVVGEDFCRRFKNYLLDTERNVNRRIISAAHFYATKWEFNIIERANPGGYLIEEIKDDIQFKQEKYHDLESMQVLLSSESLKDFIDICAHLRFQIRWSHIHRVPRTSVLGHMLIVAILSYLLSLKLFPVSERLVNNFFTGLFHDLPEVLTRDVINPVKRSVEGLNDLIKGYEKEEMERRIYKLIPANWHKDMKMFTEDEFNDVISQDHRTLRDGMLVKAIDDLAAFIEAYLSLVNGVRNQALEGAIKSISGQYKSKTICGINFADIYNQFSQPL